MTPEKSPAQSYHSYFPSGKEHDYTIKHQSVKPIFVLLEDKFIIHRVPYGNQRFFILSLSLLLFGFSPARQNKREGIEFFLHRSREHSGPILLDIECRSKRPVPYIVGWGGQLLYIGVLVMGR
jgi:hypothetical protein